MRESNIIIVHTTDVESRIASNGVSFANFPAVNVFPERGSHSGILMNVVIVHTAAVVDTSSAVRITVNRPSRLIGTASDVRTFSAEAASVAAKVILTRPGNDIIDIITGEILVENVSETSVSINLKV